MNREIKFRVWDKEEKRFIEWYNADPYIACNLGTIFCHERTKNPDGTYGEDILNNKRQMEGRLTLQQYTGLKAVGGKEIYEGDIVKFKLGQGNWDTATIVWEHFGFYLNEENGGGIPLNASFNYEVIGNIFEK